MMFHRFWLAYLSALGLGTAILYLLLPALPTPAALPARAGGESWQLPELRDPAVEKALAVLKDRQPWGAEAALAAAAAQQTAPLWRLTGAMLRGKERYVMLAVEGQPIRNLAVGDTLPDGTPILDIREDGICVKIDNQRRLLRIFER